MRHGSGEPLMRVFLTGATGYIGSATLDALLRAGHDVTALVRGLSRAGGVVARGARAVAGNLAEPAAWRDKAEGFDVYVHTAFEASPRGPEVDRTAIAALIDAARRRPGASVIYTSGVWVLGQTGRPAAEDAPVNPAPFVAFRPAHEQMVLDAQGNGLRTMVVRPGIVYGGGRGIVADLLRDAENGLMRVIGSGENRWPVVYDRDLGDLYARLAQSPGSSGIYHATNESDERVNDIVEAIAAHASSRPDVRHVPMAEARTKLGAYADALALDQLVRAPRARALGWAPSPGSITRNVPRLFEEWRNSRGDRS